MTLLGVVLGFGLICMALSQGTSSTPTTPAATAAAPSTRVPLPPPGPNNKLIAFGSKEIDSPLEDIQWSSANYVFVLSTKGNVYMSTDGGRSWVNQMSRLGAETPPKISAIFISEVDPSYVFLVGTGTDSFATTDLGKTWSVSKLSIRDIRMHPRIPQYLLASTTTAACDKKSSAATPALITSRVTNSKCYKELYVSKDFGANWELILTYVVQFDWSPKYETDKDVFPSDDLIFVTAHETRVGEQTFGSWDKDISFMSSNDYFKTSSILVKYGNRFLFGDYSYLFVATVNPLNPVEVNLQISRDNETRVNFQPAVLPVDLTEHSYTILDTSEGAVFLHVNHRPFNENADTGHVYLSDWSGLVYSLSLPYNHRSADGKCDFEKVEGLEGIYLANFIDVDERRDDEEREEARRGAATRSNAKKITHARTVITFDKGAVWSFLTPPKVDSLGKPVKCDGDCHLHLHGITDYYGPFYSTASATGLIMATGTVGSYLQSGTSQINTYLSRDAGYTWMEVRQGSHIYEFGDYGGLIVMAPDDAETDTILYSFKEGLEWYSFKIYDTPFQIENIIIEPNSVTLQFIVYGWKGQNGVMVYLDFQELHGRTCSGQDAVGNPSSDYEEWTPNDGRSGKCLMGRSVTYIRRKADSECFNPDKFERPVTHEHCVCTQDDFQCDYGYERKKPDRNADQDKSGDVCVLSDTPPKHKDPFASTAEQCIGGSYRITKGYRRVPGDRCLGGAQWDAEEVPCPAGVLTSHGAKVVLVLLVLVGISLCLVTAASKTDNMFELCSWSGIKKIFAAALARVSGAAYVKSRDHYRAVGDAESNPLRATDDEDGFLDGEELGQQAQLRVNSVTSERPSRRGGGGGINHDPEEAAPTVATPFAPLPPARRAARGPVPRLAPPTRADNDNLAV